MTKLNQVIAIEKGIKSRVHGDITAMYKAMQKPDLFNGFVKNYQPIDAEGETLPPEKKRVQFEVREVLRTVERLSTELMNVTARKDWTNCAARGTVMVNGAPLLEDVPVTYLLFLEKQLTDLRTLVGELPVLDEADAWQRDENLGVYRSDEVKTHRTKKLQKAIVLYPATPEHPAQTQLITEDILVGHWSTVKHSGATPKPDKQKLVARVETLLQAVKQAREAANMQDVGSVPEVGGAIYGFLFG